MQEPHVQIEALREAVAAGRVFVSDHADEEANADRLFLDENRASLYSGQIIESYPTDRPYPSCLVMGRSSENRPVHSVWAYAQRSGFCVLVTVYRPDPARWCDDYKIRR